MAWWGAPKDRTVSKEANRTFETEDEEDEEEEEEEEEEPEQPTTCSFQIDWQEWDNDWWWKCALVTDCELRCKKEKCPFWCRG